MDSRDKWSWVVAVLVLTGFGVQQAYVEYGIDEILLPILSAAGFFAIVVVLWMMQFRFFWASLVGIGAIASVLTALAFAVQFQILAATGMAVLALILWFGAMVVIRG